MRRVFAENPAHGQHVKRDVQGAQHAVGDRLDEALLTSSQWPGIWLNFKWAAGNCGADESWFMPAF
jgi:hypothetical protein